MSAMTEIDDYLSRRSMLTALSGLGTAGIAGCISSSSSDGESSGMADSFSLWELSDTWEPHIQSYQDATGTSINHTNKGSANLLNDLQTRILSGTGAPTTAMVEYSSLQQVSNTGGLRDISDWVDEEEIREDFPEGIWSVASSEDAIYEVPYDVGPATLFYRKDVWDEHGVDPEFETYDELIAEGEKLPDDVSIMSLPSNDLSVRWRSMYRQAGGVEFDEEGRIAFDNDTALRVIRTLQRLGQSGVVDDTASWTNPWFAGFTSGSISSHVSGAWFSGTLQSSVADAAGNWRVTKIPALESGGTRASNIGGSGLCFTEQASDAKARRAFDFVVETVTSTEQMANLFADEGNIPAYEPAWEDPAFEEGYDYFGGQAVGSVWTDIIQDVPEFRYTLDSPNVMNLLNPLLQDVVAGDLEPEAALDQWVSQSANQTGRDVA